MNSFINLLIITSHSFPFGSAAASRVRNFARGLQELNANIHVISLSYLNERINRIPGSVQEFDGIKFEILPGVLDKNGWKAENRPVLLRYQEMFEAGMMGRKRVKDLLENDLFEMVYVYGLNGVIVEPIIRTVCNHSIPCIYDVVEWPTIRYFKYGLLNPLYWINKRGTGTIAGLCDGIISISRYIENRYLQRNKNVIRIPAMVESDFYNGIILPEKDDQSSTVFNLTYVGSLADKDDPATMIAVIRSISEEGYNIRLNIIGANKDTGNGKVFYRICQREAILSERIVFRGRLSDQNLKVEILNADALVLLKVDDAISRTAFPTRLPEMLLSGRPVVTTDVGDVKEYLTDGIHAVMANPSDVNDISNRIKLLIEDRKFGVNVGKRGKAQAQQVFNNKYQSSRLLEFIINLRQNR